MLTFTDFWGSHNENVSLPPTQNIIAIYMLSQQPPEDVFFLCNQALVWDVQSPGIKDPKINYVFDHEKNNIDESSIVLEKGFGVISDRL